MRIEHRKLIIEHLYLPKKCSMINAQFSMFNKQSNLRGQGLYQSSVLNEETGNPSVLNNSPATKSLKA